MTAPAWRLWVAGAALVGFVVALFGVPARATYGAQTSGDEPYYLLTAVSLAADGDLDISDELAAGAYRPFHEVPLDRQTVPLDETGRQVSPHDPLLGLLLAAPVAIGGWIGAKLGLAAVSAATSGTTVWLAWRRLGAPPAVAGPVVIAGFAGLPLAAYGTQVYPEMPAALTLLVGLAAATAPDVGRAPAVGAALAAATLLPWWSVKFVPVAAVIGVTLLWRLRERRWVVALAIGTATLAAAAYLLAHQRIYGGWTAYAAGDHFVDTGEFGVVGTRVNLTGRARRLTGLLADRQFGLVIWSPVWLLLPPAVARSLRRRCSPSTVCLAVVTTGWFTATFVALTMHGWWVPGRQLVVVLPVALALIARWVADGSTRVRRVVLPLGTVGLVNWLWLALEASTGRRALIVDFADTAAPAVRLLHPLFPDGMRQSTLDTMLLVGWTGVLALLAWRQGSRPAAPSTAGVLLGKNSP